MALAGTLTLLCALVGCDFRDPVETAIEHRNSGRHEEALEILRELVTEESSSPQALFLYGEALQRTGQPQKAVWALRKAAEHPDWMTPANLELAAALMRSADWSGAVEAMNQILEKNPDHAAALAIRGQALSQGNLD